MKKMISAFTVLLVLFGYFSYGVKKEINSKAGLNISKGDKIESFTLQNLENTPITLDSVIANNNYVWINFWATWCSPCRREMPMMEETFNKFKDKGFAIVAVNVGEDSATVTNYLENHPVSFSVLTDQQKRVPAKFNIEMLPTSFLVDSTGVVQEVGLGIQSTWEYTIKQKLENIN